MSVSPATAGPSTPTPLIDEKLNFQYVAMRCYHGKYVDLSHPPFPIYIDLANPFHRMSRRRLARAIMSSPCLDRKGPVPVSRLVYIHQCHILTERSTGTLLNDVFGTGFATVGSDFEEATKGESEPHDTDSLKSTTLTPSRDPPQLVPRF